MPDRESLLLPNFGVIEHDMDLIPPLEQFVSYEVQFVSYEPHWGSEKPRAPPSKQDLAAPKGLSVESIDSR